LAIRAFSSAKVFSSSGNFGFSPPPTRAAAFLTKSQASWIWRVKGSMSGERRAVSSTSGAILRVCGLIDGLVEDGVERLERLNEAGQGGCVAESGMGSSSRDRRRARTGPSPCRYRLFYRSGSVIEINLLRSLSDQSLARST
jgi:hypothetical protein